MSFTLIIFSHKIHYKGYRLFFFFFYFYNSVALYDYL